MRHFVVHGSTPPKDGQKWRDNKQLNVVTTDAIRAIQLAQQRFPGLEVFSVQHHGSIDWIDDRPAHCFEAVEPAIPLAVPMS